MSFMEHLEELRSRILKALAGVAIVAVCCLYFANDLWRIVSEPATSALKHLGYPQTKLVQITPMETFMTVWFKMPLLVAIFLASPWVLYQVWAFISPGLYKRERRWAVPFVLTSASLFIVGGLFGYFLAFRYGLEFLLGIGQHIDIVPMVSVTEYFDLFVNVMLGIGLVFELPVLIFFLTLLRIASPSFLMNHSRYAILAITVVAAVVTPTPDAFNMMLFAVPMCLLFYVASSRGTCSRCTASTGGSRGGRCCAGRAGYWPCWPACSTWCCLCWATISQPTGHSSTDRAGRALT